MKIPWKKYLLWAIGIVILIFTGKKIAGMIKSKIVDRLLPGHKKKFREVAGDPTKIAIEDDQGTSWFYDLPPGVKIKDVKAARVSPEKKTLEVVIKHEPKNRRGGKPRNDNALDAFNDMHGG